MRRISYLGELGHLFLLLLLLLLLQKSGWVSGTKVVVGSTLFHTYSPTLLCSTMLLISFSIDTSKYGSKRKESDHSPVYDKLESERTGIIRASLSTKMAGDAVAPDWCWIRLAVVAIWISGS